MSSLSLRVLVFFATLVLVVASPWWMSVVVLFFLTIFVNFFVEVIFFGFLIDVMYAPTQGYVYPAIITALLMFTVVTFVKTRIRT